MIEILEMWNLRTHPFRPERDLGGNALDPKILLRPLNPRSDPRLINYYFKEIYDWRYSELVRGIREKDVFERFPDENDIANRGPVMILITGNDSTGCESLQNRILFKIQKDFGREPVLVQVALHSMDAAENIKTIASLFPYAYRKMEKEPAFEDLKKIVDAETSAATAGRKDNFSGLFQILGLEIKPTPRPLVLLVKGVDSYDLWRAVYYSVSHLFTFIIVLTKDQTNAIACHKLLADESKNVALIMAKELGFDQTCDYLAERLNKERLIGIPGQGRLAPFNNDALAALYEVGSTFTENDPPIKFSIGWLNETFTEVIDYHLQQLTDSAKKEGRSVKDLPQREVSIDASTIRAAREKINRRVGGSR